MAHWMIEIISIFNLNHRSYFLAVNLMDTFLKRTHKEFSGCSVHLIGVACMMIASKFNDSRYISLDSAHRHISSGQLKEEEILAMETEIFRTVNDVVGAITCYDIVCVLCEKYKASARVKRSAITILYLLQMYYDSLKFSINAQALSAFFISLYTLGQRNIIEEMEGEEEGLVEIKVINTIHEGMIKFPAAFPSFENPCLFLGFEFNGENNEGLFVFRPCERFE